MFIDNLTFFDVEYANSRNKSICQIGIYCENFNTGEIIYPPRSIYINPEDGFDNMCIKIHGITDKTVKNAPIFPDVWKEIEQYITNSVIIGHNVAASDLNALTKTLERYNIVPPPLYYICTLDLSKKYIPGGALSKYTLDALCDFFGIEINAAHNALDDAYACSKLFKRLVNTYSISDIQPKRYTIKEHENFASFISNTQLRKIISDFYGVVRGFSIDNEISKAEFDYLTEWKNRFSKNKSYPEINDIVNTLDQILKDGIVTIEESSLLQQTIKKYLDTASTSPITLATQVLDGIINGIIVDGNISELECKNLRLWLYDNIYLTGHYPFDKLLQILESSLDDGIITPEESNYISDTIKEILDPIKSLKEQINSVNGKHICLSGNFKFGTKSDMQNYIINNGGLVDSSVKKTTDILIIGDMGCQEYSNGTYGTKVKKAIEYNDRGCCIQIMKESDFFANLG